MVLNLGSILRSPGSFENYSCLGLTFNDSDLIDLAFGPGDQEF